MALEYSSEEDGTALLSDMANAQPSYWMVWSCPLRSRGLEGAGIPSPWTFWNGTVVLAARSVW
jgi:hypothetical protein